MATKNTPRANAPKLPAREPAKPWGQKILAQRAAELLRAGAIAPSAVMGNLLMASAHHAVDLDMLSARPRPMSDAANRAIASALQRSRLPNADISAILHGLMDLAWTDKSSPATAIAAALGAKARPKTGVKSAKGAKPAMAAREMPKKGPATPVIVRKAAKARPPSEA